MLVIHAEVLVSYKVHWYNNTIKLSYIFVEMIGFVPSQLELGKKNKINGAHASDYWNAMKPSKMFLKMSQNTKEAPKFPK